MVSDLHGLTVDGQSSAPAVRPTSRSMSWDRCDEPVGEAIRPRRWSQSVSASAAVGPQPGPKRPPFADSSSAEVRRADPEEAAEFDRQWCEVMAKATQTLDLTGVLESWRRIAWLTAANGPDAHR